MHRNLGCRRGFPKNSRSAFSVLELLVVIGILLILISIFIPYLLKKREISYRFQCADNLRQLYSALSSYAHLNNGNYPRVIYDAAGNSNGYTCYTGANAGDPFAKNSGVKPNDVTASLWLLVRLRLASPINFTCPSTSDDADFVNTSSGELALRGNFRGPGALSYSYASPFSSASGYKLNDTRRAGFALMADKNPGYAGAQSNAAAPSVNAPPLEMAVANSNNHRKAGQNVLYTDSHVEFKDSPYCGFGDENQPDLHDNIYTALSAKPLERGQYMPRYANGVLGRDVGPAWDFDSYLVPTSIDQLELPPAPVATRPTTAPVTKPTSRPTTSKPTTIPAAIPSTAPTTKPTTTTNTTLPRLSLPTTRPARPATTTSPTTRPTTKP